MPYDATRTENAVRRNVAAIAKLDRERRHALRKRDAGLARMYANGATWDRMREVSGLGFSAIHDALRRAGVDTSRDRKRPLVPRPR